MIEILPIHLLTDDDTPVFGKLSVFMGKLHRLGLPVGRGFVITAPEFKLKTVLEQFDFGTREIIEQSLTLVKKEILSIPLPEQLKNETKKHNRFYLNGEVYKSTKQLWQELLILWIEQIKERLFNNGFYKGISLNLDPQIIIFIKKVQSYGSAFFDPVSDDVIISTKGVKLHPSDLKKIADLVQVANKKLFIPQIYEWIIDGEVKLTNIKPYTGPLLSQNIIIKDVPIASKPNENKCAVKVFFDLSRGYSFEKNVDGIFMTANGSFDDMAFKLVEAAITFSDSPVYFRLKGETLNLLHQKSALDPMINALDFARHKRGLSNIHIVVPYVRGAMELSEIKRELAAGKLARKNSLQIWMEVCTPENIINLDKYLEAGIDGVVLNMDKLIALCNGFDSGKEEELAYYKSEVEGLLKFLEEPLEFLHKEKIPFIVSGDLVFESRVLEFLVEKGVYGVVAPKYIAHSAKDLLYQVEKRMLLRRS